MYYGVITVSTKPGIRFKGIDHLKKFADWFESKYEVRTQILGNMHGAIYRNHVVSRYDSLAHMESIYEKMLADPEYLEWFEEGKDMIVWEDSSQSIYQVF